MQGYLSKTLSPILPVVSLTQEKSSSETAVNGSSSEKMIVIHLPKFQILLQLNLMARHYFSIKN